MYLKQIFNHLCHKYVSSRSISEQLYNYSPFVPLKCTYKDIDFTAKTPAFHLEGCTVFIPQHGIKTVLKQCSINSCTNQYNKGDNELSSKKGSMFQIQITAQFSNLINEVGKYAE